MTIGLRKLYRREPLEIAQFFRTAAINGGVGNLGSVGRLTRTIGLTLRLTAALMLAVGVLAAIGGPSYADTDSSALVERTKLVKDMPMPVLLAPEYRGSLTSSINDLSLLRTDFSPVQPGRALRAEIVSKNIGDSVQYRLVFYPFNNETERVRVNAERKFTRAYDKDQEGYTLFEVPIYILDKNKYRDRLEKNYYGVKLSTPKQTVKYEFDWFKDISYELRSANDKEEDENPNPDWKSAATNNIVTCITESDKCDANLQWNSRVIADPYSESGQPAILFFPHDAVELTLKEYSEICIRTSAPAVEVQVRVDGKSLINMPGAKAGDHTDPFCVPTLVDFQKVLELGITVDATGARQRSFTFRNLGVAESGGAELTVLPPRRGSTGLIVSRLLVTVTGVEAAVAISDDSNAARMAPTINLSWPRFRLKDTFEPTVGTLFAALELKESIEVTDNCPKKIKSIEELNDISIFSGSVAKILNNSVTLKVKNAKTFPKKQQYFLFYFWGNGGSGNLSKEVYCSWGRWFTPNTAHMDATGDIVAPAGTEVPITLSVVFGPVLGADQPNAAEDSLLSATVEFLTNGIIVDGISPMNASGAEVVDGSNGRTFRLTGDGPWPFKIRSFKGVLTACEPRTSDNQPAVGLSCAVETSPTRGAPWEVRLSRTAGPGTSISDTFSVNLLSDQDQNHSLKVSWNQPAELIIESYNNGDQMRPEIVSSDSMSRTIRFKRGWNYFFVTNKKELVYKITGCKASDEVRFTLTDDPVTVPHCAFYADKTGQLPSGLHAEIKLERIEYQLGLKADVEDAAVTIKLVNSNAGSRKVDIANLDGRKNRASGDVQFSAFGDDYLEVVTQPNRDGKYQLEINGTLYPILEANLPYPFPLSRVLEGEAKVVHLAVRMWPERMKVTVRLYPEYGVAPDGGVDLAVNRGGEHVRLARLKNGESETLRVKPGEILFVSPGDPRAYTVQDRKSEAKFVGKTPDGALKFQLNASADRTTKINLAVIPPKVKLPTQITFKPVLAIGTAGARMALPQCRVVIDGWPISGVHRGEDGTVFTFRQPMEVEPGTTFNASLQGQSSSFTECTRLRISGLTAEDLLRGEVVTEIKPDETRILIVVVNAVGLGPRHVYLWRWALQKADEAISKLLKTGLYADVRVYVAAGEAPAIKSDHAFDNSLKSVLDVVSQTLSDFEEGAERLDSLSKLEGILAGKLASQIGGNVKIDQLRIVGGADQSCSGNTELIDKLPPEMIGHVVAASLIGGVVDTDDIERLSPSMISQCKSVGNQSWIASYQLDLNRAVSDNDRAVGIGRVVTAAADALIEELKEK